MSVVKILYTYGAMFAAFLAIDLVWLGIVARGFYQSQIGSLMRSAPNWTAAIIFYVVFVVGVMIFGVLPGVEKNSLIHALIYGALFGFFTYMTYELTNYAVLKDWPFWIVIVDILWGVVLAGTVSAVGYFIAKL